MGSTRYTTATARGGRSTDSTACSTACSSCGRRDPSKFRARRCNPSLGLRLFSCILGSSCSSSGLACLLPAPLRLNAVVVTVVLQRFLAPASEFLQGVIDSDCLCFKLGYLVRNDILKLQD